MKLLKEKKIQDKVNRDHSKRVALIQQDNKTAYVDGMKPGIEFFEKIVGIAGRIDIADTYGQYF